MPGPAKPYPNGAVGTQAQANFELLQKLFSAASGQTTRDSLFACASEEALRTTLGAAGITIPAPIRIILVDVENARMKDFGAARGAPTNEDFYMLVLPPVPRRSGDPKYVEAQTWEAAWHHAVVEGYGM